MVSFTREFAHLSLKGKHAAQPISTSSPAAAPRRAYTPPRLLENVAEVLRVTSGEPLVVVYLYVHLASLRELVIVPDINAILPGPASPRFVPQETDSGTTADTFMLDPVVWNLQACAHVLSATSPD